MSEEAREMIEALARKCALKGLRLRDAQALFGALYRADVLAVAGGNMTRAAELAGVNREAFLRMQKKQDIGQGAGESSTIGNE